MSNDGKSKELKYFDPMISGLRGILCQKPDANSKRRDGFAYYPSSGLNLVVHGPAGSGKSIFALQMAMGAIRSRKNVILLTKDTSPETHLKRLWKVFNCFEVFKEVGCCDKEDPKPPDKTYEVEDFLIPTKNACLLLEGFYEREDDGGQGSIVWRTALLDRVAKATSSDGPQASRSNVDKKAPQNKTKPHVPTAQEAFDEVFKKLEQKRDAVTLAIGHLGLVHAGEFDRYAANESIYDGLSRLCPALRPVFEVLNNKASDPRLDENSPWWGWREDFVVICDSLPLSVLEDCLRTQSEGPGAMSTAETKRRIRPITVFVLESVDMPDPMTASFPPDVQIKMGSREEAYGKRTRTIQVLKSRYQRIHNEPFPFVFSTVGEAHDPVESVPADITCCANKKCKPGFLISEEQHEQWMKSDDPWRVRRKPGISIIRSIPSMFCEHLDPSKSKLGSSDANSLDARKPGHLRFGCEDIDKLTTEGYLSGGGTTLLVTENRCHSTALSLHFLLGDMKRRILKKGEDSQGSQPNSVLLIGLDTDILGVLHEIWRYETLRACIQKASRDGTWTNIEEVLLSWKPKADPTGKHVLYRIKIEIPEEKKVCPVHENRIRESYLFVLIPGLVWCTCAARAGNGLLDR